MLFYWFCCFCSKTNERITMKIRNTKILSFSRQNVDSIWLKCLSIRNEIRWFGNISILFGIFSKPNWIQMCLEFHEMRKVELDFIVFASLKYDNLRHKSTNLRVFCFFFFFLCLLQLFLLVLLMTLHFLATVFCLFWICVPNIDVVHLFCKCTTVNKNKHTGFVSIIIFFYFQNYCRSMDLSFDCLFTFCYFVILFVILRIEKYYYRCRNHHNTEIINNHNLFRYKEFCIDNNNETLGRLDWVRWLSYPSPSCPPPPPSFIGCSLSLLSPL